MHRRNRRDHRVFVGPILTHDGDVAVTPGGDVDQLLYWIPPQGVDAIAIGDRGDDLPCPRVQHHRRLTAPRENAVGGAVVGNAGRTLARRERPRREGRHRLFVDHLDRARALVVDEDLALSVAGRAFRPVVLELDGTDHGAALRVDPDHGADRTTVVGENAAVGAVVVHDAGEATPRHRDPLAD